MLFNYKYIVFHLFPMERNLSSVLGFGPIIGYTMFRRLVQTNLLIVFDILI